MLDTRAGDLDLGPLPTQGVGAETRRAIGGDYLSPANNGKDSRTWL